jgi:hypothetical protein
MKCAPLFAAFVATLGFAGGCTQFPELDRTLTPTLAAQDYPDLVPLASAQSTTVEPAQTNAALDARISALKARAARLRGNVLSGAERQRLAQGLR